MRCPDRRHRNVLGFQSAIWNPLSRHDAHQLVWPGRQLRPAEFPRPGGSYTQISRGQGATRQQCDAVGNGNGEMVFDPGKPDGTPRKLLDVTRIYACGWRPSVDLRTG